MDFYIYLPSTVDWCEQNYTVSSFIAEFYNTITGICIFISIWTFKYNNNDLFDSKKNGNFSHYLNNIYAYMSLVSLGTILFHGTLFYPFQLLDEIPLLLVTIEYAKLVLYISDYNQSQDLFFNKLFSYDKYFCLIISFSYFINSKLQILLFHSILKIFEFIVFN